MELTQVSVRTDNLHAHSETLSELFGNKPCKKKRKFWWCCCNFLFRNFLWQIWFLCALWTACRQRVNACSGEINYRALWEFVPPSCFSCRPVAVLCKTDVIIIIMQTNLTSVITHAKLLSRKIWLVLQRANGSLVKVLVIIRPTLSIHLFSKAALTGVGWMTAVYIVCVFALRQFVARIRCQGSKHTVSPDFYQRYVRTYVVRPT